MNYIMCFDESSNFNFISKHEAPFDVGVDCHKVDVFGKDLRGMRLRGKCVYLTIRGMRDYKNDDLSGFMDLEIGTLVVGLKDMGLLKILELNCKKIICRDEKLEKLMNKYMEEDVLMRDFEGFKLEMAVNGFGDRL